MAAGINNVEADDIEARSAARRFTRHGWLMIGVAFLTIGVGMGNQYTAGFLIPLFREKFQASVSSILLGTVSVMLLMMALVSPLCGSFIRKFSARALFVVGISALAFGYLGIAYASRYWQIVLTYAVLFSVGAQANLLAANTLVANWYVTRRAWALSIATSGMTAAGFVIPPVFAYLLDSLGLRVTALVMSGAFASLIPVVWWMVVERPEQIGLFPDGQAAAPRAEVEDGPANVTQWTVRRALRHRPLWIVIGTAGVGTAQTTALPANFIPLAGSLGVSSQATAYLLSCISVCAMMGMIACGALFDRLGLRVMVRLSILALSVAVLLILGHRGYPTLIAASVLLGLASGAIGIAPSVLAGVYFGREGFAVGYSVTMLFTILLMVLMIPLLGWSYDLSGSYQPALKGMIALLVAVFLSVQLLPLPKAD